MLKRLATGVTALGLTVSSPAHAFVGSSLPTALPGLETAPPFTAEVQITSAAVPTPTVFRIAYMPQRVRLESKGQDGMLAIMRMDEGNAYLFQGEGSWLRLSLASLGATGLNPGTRHAIKKLGNQTVDGRPCEVYQTSSPDGMVAMNYVAGGMPFKSIVKAPTGGTTTVRYLNVSRGGVHEGLFTVPAGEEVTDMAGLLNGLKGRKGANPSLDDL